MQEDHKVSQLCTLPDKKLFSLVQETAANNKDDHPHVEYFINQLIAAGMGFDEHHFEKIFSNCLVRFGLKEAYVQVLYPMLVRIGLMWTSDVIPPASEHFISNLVRQKLFAAIDALPPPGVAANKWVLFLKEGEFHEIGLLFASYMLKKVGEHVIYLGPDMPQASLLDACRSTRPDYLLFFLVHQDDAESISEYCEQLKRSFTGTKILIAADARTMRDVKLGKKLVWIQTVRDLESELAK
jgi:methanogenic corrinoid protein MtbC1